MSAGGSRRAKPAHAKTENGSTVERLRNALDNIVGQGAQHEHTCDEAEHDPESPCIWCEARAALAGFERGERVSAVRIQRRQVGARTFDAITVCMGDLHLSCDAVNARQLRLAARLAQSYGIEMYVSPEMRERVARALERR